MAPLAPNTTRQGTITTPHCLSCDLVGRVNEFSVQSFVALRGRVPRKIARHSLFYQLGPETTVAVDLPRTFDRVPERLAGIFITEKTVTAVRCRIVILNNLLNSAGDARDRQSAILQIVHRA